MLIERPVSDTEWCYYSNDYVAGELVTHAESCFRLVGFSRMGEALNAQRDVHSDLGAQMMGIPYEEFIRRLKSGDKLCEAFRQAAKAGNFGFPGGMGCAKMVAQQRKQGPDTPCPNGPTMVSDGKGGFVPGYKGLRFCVLVKGASQCGTVKVTEWKDRPTSPTCLACIHVAEEIRKSWFQRWPENRPVFKKVAAAIEGNNEITQHYSNHVRGGVQFTEAANSLFQSLLAIITGRAFCRVSYEQYAVPTSPLYGVSRNILFAHDEIFGECLVSHGHEVSMRVNEIMVEEQQKGCPNHKPACKAEPTLMPRWWKAAKPVWKDGRLVPWTPK